MTHTIHELQFPHFEKELRNMIRQHKKIRHEPLVWAIYYKPTRNANDIFLFEVLENFGNGGVDPNRELFEVTYGYASGFPMNKNQELHLVLTNPAEFKRAANEKWDGFKELNQAVVRGDFKILSPLKTHTDLQRLLNV